MKMPAGYQALKGSERSRPNGARLLGPADPAERITARIILRRRTDVPAAADLEARLSTHPMRREVLSADEHAQRFGASSPTSTKR